jgi:hypothetical protein
MKKLLYAAFAFLCLPVLAQTHRYQVSAITAMQSGIVAPTPTDWYVSSIGGPRSICDGKANAAPVGTLPGQHCAFNDIRSLWTDGSYTTNASAGFPAWGWVGTGGDRYHIQAGQWRVGQSGPNSGDYLGLAGDPFGAGAPPPPSGTAAIHTQILGENFAACNQGNMTQVFGGFGVFDVFNLGSTGYVDMKCIELTRHSQCTRFGSPAIPAGCNSGFPLDDYATNGIITDPGTHDILLQDMWIHGFTSRGIIGPIGGTVTATRVDIAYNGAAGWDFDDGSATPSVNALLNADGLTVEWNGCNQAYPGPGAVSCYSQSTGGYGDGIGTPAGTCISANVTNSIFRYNTQDGYDMLHNNVGNCKQVVTNSAAYGNNGQGFKWGPANSGSILSNSLIVANCSRLSAAFPGQPSTYNANLADSCRADDAIALDFYNGTTMTFSNNTIITTAPTTFDIQCVDSKGCANSSFTFSNNIVRAYSDPIEGGYGGDGAPGGWCLQGCNGTTLPLGTITRTNNTYFGLANFTPVATEKVADPLFVSEPTGTGATFTEVELDNFNFALTSGSPAIGQGATSTGVVVTPPPPPPPPPPVVPTTPTITWNNPASIVSGTALSGTQLNAKASVLGSFTYTPAAGTIPAVGPDTLSVTFVPTDTTHYTNATATVQIMVLPPPPPPPPPTPAPKAFSFNVTTTSTKTITCTPTLSGTTWTWSCK